MASIRDVANVAGVSTATVSRTFTTPNLINALTQQRVLAAARSLDYLPPRLRSASSLAGVGKSLKRNSKSLTHAIGFQYFAATTSSGDTLAANDFYMPVLSGAQTEAACLGLHMLVHEADRHATFLETPRMMTERALDGLLLVNAADPTALRSVARYAPNIVLVDNHDEIGKWDSVVSDGFGGTLNATHHLLDLGHRRIGFFLPELGVTSFQDRLRGYQCAMLEIGICPTPNLVFGVDATKSADRRADMACRLMATERPTAVICANDDSALFLMRLCRDIGLRIPGDLSIVGFDDIPFAMRVEPSLTTVRVDKVRLGRLAVSCLHGRLNNASGARADRTPIRHVAPVSLVVRHSCCPPSRAADNAKKQ